MREIKFRGFTTNYTDNEWVEGDLIHYDKDEFCIMPQNGRYWDISHDGDRVIKESIGQYTGLKDKNGKEIYEGDILRFENVYEDEDVMYIKWDKECVEFYLMGLNEAIALNIWFAEDTEVIGNIFENKELLNN